MRRSSDVRLELGFHGVVNRSQRNIDEGMSRQKLWNKEELIFTKSHRMKLLPKENWGTSRLMEKVAKIQEARVDECLPRMKEAVRKTLGDLRARLRELPHQPETESDQARLFNSIVAEIRRDLGRRIRAEFVSAKSSDRELTIAPKIDSMVQEYKADLLARNPEWLQEEMIDEVDYRVRTYARGYTVDNLIGSEVFRNLIRQTFIEEGLLKESIEALVTEVGEHPCKVVWHVINMYANLSLFQSVFLREFCGWLADSLFHSTRLPEAAEEQLPCPRIKS